MSLLQRVLSKRKRKHVAIFLAFILLILALHEIMINRRLYPSGVWPHDIFQPVEELVSCKIPSVDPYNPQITSVLEDYGTDIVSICSEYSDQRPSFLLVNNTLVLAPGVNENTIDKNSITLFEVLRESDFKIQYKPLGNPFEGKESVRQSNDVGDSDFIRVMYEVNKTRKTDAYSRIRPRRDVLEHQMNKAKEFANTGMTMNILLLGIDSTSRANVERKMPGVIQFLKENLTTYFMNGMSIVGDATTPAFTAILTGKKLSELPEARRSQKGATHIDDWPWIFREYESQGYMTLLAEDDPYLAAYNLRMHGFKEPPTHHYQRKFWQTVEKERELRDKDLCFKANSPNNITFEYLLDFYEAYPNCPKFALAFLCYITHNKPNRLSLLENDLLAFLRTFVKRGHHKNTVFVFFGDHGSRTSSFRNTIQGKLEERLPMFSISLPPTFPQDFPTLLADLATNRNMITSQFDIHATLRHILNYPVVPSGSHSQSLFTKLPRNRTCSDAGIDEHFCVCHNWAPVNLSSPNIPKLALAVVGHINAQLSNISTVSKLCHPLTLDSTLNAYKLDVRSMKFVGKERNADAPRYQITISTKPNNGLYEATGSVTADGLVRVEPDLSRINRYNNQPKCIAETYPNLMKFCFCRDQ